MSDISNECKAQDMQEAEVSNVEASVMDSNEGRTEDITKRKITKKKLILLGGILVTAIVAAIILIPSEFERITNECVQIAGQASTGDGYFILDTYPDTFENMDETLKALLLPDAQEDALEAIRFANDELGFPGSVYSQMLKTSALMGRQSEENSKYKVSWTYHPDSGLEVTYTEK